MTTTSNMDYCAKIKDMTAIEAVQTIKVLASKIQGPVALGLWDGRLTGKISGQTYSGEHIAVFRDKDLLAPFGQRGNEACAALFAVVLAKANKIAAALVR